MANLFNSVKMFKPRTSNFSLSHDVKLSFNPGELIPICCIDAVPGDRFRIGCESLIRFQPLVSPLMHRADATIHYFFVPKRLLWDGYEDWIIGKPTAPAHPYLEVFSAEYSRLMDYFGIPAPDPLGQFETISPLAFSAYQAIYHEYYRDQNLVAEFDYKCSNGNNSGKLAMLKALRQRAWGHDYFTSALPFAQKGSSVDIPLGDVQLKPNWDAGSNSPRFETEGGAYDTGDVIQTNTGTPQIELTGEPTMRQAYDPDGTLSTEATTINDLRLAERLQQFLEKAARGGTRYIEFIKSMFGVHSSDKRLQRPEYITGVKSPVIISEVLNTTGTDDLPQGNMSGHAFTKVSGKYGRYYVEEFGYIIGLMSLIPKTAYQQGIPKHFLKYQDYTQNYFPDFAHLGEQAILNKELYAYQASGEDTFGYIPRYAEYKFENNRVAGDFRDDLSFWHWGRIFGNQPSLNQSFIECVPRTDIFAVEDPTEQKMLAQVYNDITAIRPMPKFGTPRF